MEEKKRTRIPPVAASETGRAQAGNPDGLLPKKESEPPRNCSLSRERPAREAPSGSPLERGVGEGENPVRRKEADEKTSRERGPPFAESSCLRLQLQEPEKRKRRLVRFATDETRGKNTPPGGRFHPRLNKSESPIAHKYREGKMQSTPKGEFKVLEIVKRETIEPVRKRPASKLSPARRPPRTAGGRRPGELFGPQADQHRFRNENKRPKESEREKPDERGGKEKK